jgi:hypothetical protein
MEQGRIHSVDLLNLALDSARQLGYQVRDVVFGGFPGGACQLKGTKWIFLNSSLPARDRLQLVLEALARDPNCVMANLPPALLAAIQVARKTQQETKAG